MNKQLWICPTCRAKLITFVALSEPPTCNNAGKHSQVDMQTKKGNQVAVDETRKGTGGEPAD
jgi:hypothetical protein